MSPDRAQLTGRPLGLSLVIGGIAPNEPVPIEVRVDGSTVETLELAAGEHSIELPTDAKGRQEIEVRSGSASATTSTRAVSAWLAVVPPLVAIGLALIFKDVILSLFLGVFAGSLFLYHWNPFAAFARTIDTFIVPAVADPNQASILVFTTLLGGMVGLISRSGGTQGIVDFLTPYATSPKRGQISTWLLGIVIFFDDYANTLIVGPTMRPITDRLRISREKLAYIVDSTAAPVVSVFPISTWVGFEVGLIGAALTAIELDLNPYATFVGSIPYRFYPILALVLGLTIAASRRDRGPMLRAERRATTTGEVVGADDVPLADYTSQQLTPPEGKPRRAFNAVLPILTVAFVTVLGLYLTGSVSVARGDYDSTFLWVRDVFANADSYRALLWASLSGATVALVLPLVQKILTVRQATEALVEGFRAMLLAFVVLILAWSIGGVCTELRTADYLVGLTSGLLAPAWVPLLTFLLSAGISFATGTAWGTMAILTPLVIPIIHGLSMGAGLPIDGSQFQGLLMATVASVLSGSVWGDHCSPISDTTILSSMASGCDHIAHVRTQAPYALGVGGVAIAIGSIPAGLGMNPFLSLLISIAIIVPTVLFFFRPVDAPGT